jgi:hypothetical protein
VDEAMVWNSQSLRAFIFFALQLVMRLGLALTALRAKVNFRTVGITDAAVSGVVALTAFYPFFRVLWISLF